MGALPSKNSVPWKVVVLPTRNDSFQKTLTILPTRNASFRKMDGLMMAQGHCGCCQRGQNGKCGFRRSGIHAGCMEIMENDRNRTHMALLGLKLGQNECQRGCEFNGHPSNSLKPLRKFKMIDFGLAGGRPTNHIKILYETPDQPLKRPLET